MVSTIKNNKASGRESWEAATCFSIAFIDSQMLQATRLFQVSVPHPSHPLQRLQPKCAKVRCNAPTIQSTQFYLIPQTDMRAENLTTNEHVLSF